MKKHELRKIFIAKRNQLAQAEYDDLNQRLLQQFRQTDLQGVNYLHLFLPIHERKEPDTYLMRDWLREHHPHIQRIFPKANFADHSMQNFVDDDNLQLGINAFGIPEPVAGQMIGAAKIDMVMLPLLAFDLQGYRAGYGKGFYDRFIAQCRPDVQLIGLSFFDPVDAIDDVNVFDQRMHQCITPDKVYTFC